MDLIKKSIRVIKSLQLRNGGILATPESGAYPYIYSRDAVIMTKALNKVGLTKKSKKFYYFMKNLARVEHYGKVMHRYNTNGLPAVTRKHQHDNSALLIHGIHDTSIRREKDEFLVDMWPLVKTCVKHVLFLQKNGLVKTASSIHENDVLESGFELWANCAACRALYDASEIAKKLKCRKEGKKWHAAAEKLKANINKKLFNKKTGLYRKNPKHPGIADISQLSPFYFEISDSHQILKKTMQHLRKHIWAADLGGFRRFKKFEIVKDWHWYTGGSGTWLVLTLWGARFYRDLGDKKGYKDCVDFVEKVASRTSGLLPEHIATREEYEIWKENEVEFNYRIINEMQLVEKRSQKFKEKYDEDIVYWALPLGWSHAEYILLMKK